MAMLFHYSMLFLIQKQIPSYLSINTKLGKEMVLKVHTALLSELGSYIIC